MHDAARLGADGERGRVGDGVRDADGLDLEGADALRLPGLRAPEVDVVESTSCSAARSRTRLSA